MAFRWRADDGPLLVLFCIGEHYFGAIKKLSELDPVWQNFLDPCMNFVIFQGVHTSIPMETYSFMIIQCRGWGPDHSPPSLGSAQACMPYISIRAKISRVCMHIIGQEFSGVLEQWSFNPEYFFKICKIKFLKE